MKKLLGFTVAVVMVAVASPALAGETIQVPLSLWDRPRSGRVIAELPQVQQAVHAYLARPSTRLIIHHAGDQERLLQAEELRAWLVALAVSTQRVVLRSDLARREALKIEVVP